MSETPGLLIVWMNIAPGHEADFDGWYTREHIPERVGVPGFRNGTRYVALHGEPSFLAVYDTDAPDVLDSAPYHGRLNNPTPWTQRVMPAFRDTVRGACRLLGEAGLGIGGILRTIRIEPAEGRRDELRTALAGPLLQTLLEQPGIARVRAVESIAPARGTDTAETAIRGKDRTATFVLLVDATEAGALETACNAHVSESQLAALGARSPVEAGDYRLMYTLSR